MMDEVVLTRSLSTPVQVSCVVDEVVLMCLSVGR